MRCVVLFIRESGAGAWEVWVPTHPALLQRVDPHALALLQRGHHYHNQHFFGRLQEIGIFSAENVTIRYLWYYRVI